MRTGRPAPRGGKPDQRRAGGDPASGDSFLYGRNSAFEALAGRRRPKRLLVADGVKEDERLHQLLSLAETRSVPVERIDRRQLDDLTGFANHQGVCLVAGPYPYAPIDDLLQRQGTILVLDHLQDPQNFGTLLRAAESCGVAGVVMPADRAVDVTPAVVNASAGAVEHLLVARVANLPRALGQAKSAGWWIIGLDRDERAVDLFSAALPQPAALVVGSEGAGLGSLVRRHCDLIAEIPMTGKVASLNAATAGSVALFELFRRSRTGPATTAPDQKSVP
ncbi:MAG: 23S rRNA (guanosine(2251)-2'-O)-methyltransferase RlmB [Thermomicrobiales bacterium]